MSDRVKDAGGEGAVVQTLPVVEGRRVSNRSIFTVFCLRSALVLGVYLLSLSRGERLGF